MENPLAENPIVAYTDETPQLAARGQLRRLLRGDLRMLGPLARKGGAALRARVALRRCTRVGRYVRVSGRPVVSNRGEILIGDRVQIRSTIVRCELLAYPGGRLEIGPRTYINFGCSITARASVRIGADCLLGPYTSIHDDAFHDIEDRARQPTPRPVVIGAGVWLGERVIVLPGVTIGDGAVVGAGAVVTRDVPPRSVAAGNPARVLRTF